VFIGLVLGLLQGFLATGSAVLSAAAALTVATVAEGGAYLATWRKAKRLRSIA
jgi:hypothetical protein